MFPILPLIGSLGSFLGGGAGSSQTTDTNYSSDTSGTSNIDRTEFSPEMLKALEGLFGNGNLQKQFDTSQSALSGQLQQVQKQGAQPFDVAAFVAGINKQANNTIDNATEQGVNLAESNIGASQGKSSMAALLASKLGTDAAAQKAGITSQATAQGTQIQQAGEAQTTQSILGLTGAMNKSLTDFLSILRGAKTNQTQNTTEHTEGQSTSTTDTPFNFLGGLGDLLGSFKPKGTVG